MKTPAIIFTLFIVAAGAIIALNKNTPKHDMFWMPKSLPFGTNPDIGAAENFTGPTPLIKPAAQNGIHNI